MAPPYDDDSARPSAKEERPGPPRLGPRPLTRPEVDPAAVQVFGRPPGVTGAFAETADTSNTSQRPPAGSTTARRGGDTGPFAATPPPSEALAAAFGRPPGSGEQLQRPPSRNGSRPGPEDDAFWGRGAGSDPWRDPDSTAVLGAPAVSEDGRDGADEPAAMTGARLSLREVLFGRRLSPRALAVLGAVVVLIGGAGGFVGRLTAEVGSPLTDPDATLAQVEPAIDRPAGSVAAVAERVLPAV
ncbi:MAG TPA: serine protease, partial [Pseudonocardiaceae bacterium]|nr:serine protease [Pseudonocardiaceae bacterium]